MWAGGDNDWLRIVALQLRCFCPVMRTVGRAEITWEMDWTGNKVWRLICEFSQTSCRVPLSLPICPISSQHRCTTHRGHSKLLLIFVGFGGNVMAEILPIWARNTPVKPKNKSMLNQLKLCRSVMPLYDNLFPVSDLELGRTNWCFNMFHKFTSFKDKVVLQFYKILLLQQICMYVWRF